MTGWQPIETAPRDGTTVLVANEDCMMIANRLDDLDFAIFVKMYDGWHLQEHLQFVPTHWMPLPQLPKVKE